MRIYPRTEKLLQRWFSRRLAREILCNAMLGQEHAMFWVRVCYHAR